MHCIYPFTSRSFIAFVYYSDDSYGRGFLKHNTNSGFVDLEERRKTPQVFSAHSFYASEGQRLVADVQGVGDLYTDPQILSMDYRFGDGDLGPRGMVRESLVACLCYIYYSSELIRANFLSVLISQALYFKTFRHCDLSDRLGIPIFPLSRNERMHQAKYDDDESTLSDEFEEAMCRFKRMDENRQRRKSVLMRPIDILSQSGHNSDTAKR